MERSAPTNLDGMVDLIRESGLSSITVTGSWQVDTLDSERIEEVCDDLDVALKLNF